MGGVVIGAGLALSVACIYFLGKEAKESIFGVAGECKTYCDFQWGVVRMLCAAVVSVEWCRLGVGKRRVAVSLP